MIAAFGVESLAQVSVVRIVDCLLEGTLIAFFAGFAARLAARQNAGTRFAVWFYALMVIAITPLLSGVAWIHYAGNAATKSPAPITLPGSWAVYLFAIWAAIAALLLLRIGISLWRLHALRREFIPVDPEILDVSVQEILQRAENRRATLCTSSRVQVPAAIGLIEPVVVVPDWLLQELSAEELRQILLHELAHLRRRDDWTNLIQKVVKAIFFFHPAVWWIEKQISLEREMACDDEVLRETASAWAYAECLKNLAEKTLVRRTLAFAQAAFGQMRQTSLRVARMLDAKRPQVMKSPWKIAMSCAGFIVLCGLFAAKEPNLVAFQPSAPAVESAASAGIKNSMIIPAAFTSRMPLNPIHTHAKPTLLKAKAVHINSGMEVPQARTAKVFGDVLSGPPQIIPALASLRIPMVSSEMVFVVVESRVEGKSGQQTYELQLWHLTVFQPDYRVIHREFLHKEI
jgi:beta-lactamase regulating signal transducer with metallopeptidase domain